MEATNHPRVIAIGECGLDYYYDKSGRAAQRERFQAHIEAARKTGLPLVVHTRDAEDDTTEILTREVGKGGVTGVLHCFTGSAGLARKALVLGFYISISGIVTFKNARTAGHRQAIPQDRLLVETDCPSWRRCRIAASPASRRLWRHRGFLSDLRDEPLDELADATTANFFRLFNKAAA